MARRSKKKSNDKTLFVAGGVLVAVVAGAVAFVFSGNNAKSGGNADKDTADFSISAYRKDASRLTGNSYRIVGRVENIDTLGNDRLVAVSIDGTKQERLPLLVRQGVTGKVNLSRGDSFIFDVDCRTGQDEEGKEVKGILVVRKVESK